GSVDRRESSGAGVRPRHGGSSMNEERPPPGDYAPEPEPEREPTLEDHIKAKATWLRLLFMIVMLVLYSISRIVVIAVVVIQFLYVLFTGRTNERLLGLGQSLATYTYQIVQYLTYNTEQRPFPFDLDWPPGHPPAE